MSTVFAVKVTDDLIEVAHRKGGRMVWVNHLAEFLPDDMNVIPVDNSSQGIHTIGDIKKAIETGVICPKEEE